MRAFPAVLALVLLLAAGLSGLLVGFARRGAGIEAEAVRMPLGGFEPVAVDLLTMRATALLDQQRLPEALAAVRVVTELQPRVAEGWALLGHLLAWRNSESAADPREQWRFAREGIEVVRRGVELNPRSAFLLGSYASLLFNRVVADSALAAVAEEELGRPPALLAREAFRRLRREHPDYRPAQILPGLADTSRRLGILLISRGEREAAREPLREALALYEEFARAPHAEVARQRVEEIRKLLE